MKGYTEHYNYYFPKEKETFLSFDKWKIFYEADPANWYILNKQTPISYYGSSINMIDFSFPVYHKSNGEKQYIKFLTKRDYKKYLRYVKNLFDTGENYSNLQEITALAMEIRQRAEECTIAAQQETQKLYNKYKTVLEKTSLDLLK